MKRTEIMNRLGKIIGTAAIAAIAVFAVSIPAKADVISEAQSGYERGMAYLLSTQVTPDSQVVKDAQSGYERGMAYLQSIQQSTIAWAIEVDRQAEAGAVAGQAYLDSIFLKLDAIIVYYLNHLYY